MIKLIDEGKFSSCDSISSDLLKIAWTLDLKEEVLICELFEGVFEQAQEPMDNFVMPAEDNKKMREELSKHMKNFILYYTAKKKEELFNSLIEIRYVVTNYQYIARQSYEVKPPEHVFRSR